MIDSHCKILDLRKTVNIGRDGIEANQEVVLAFVIALDRITVCESFESSVRQAFVVVAPADTLVFE